MQVRLNQNKSDLEKNRVIVRVWSSGYNLHNRGKSVGHISVYLEKEDLYVSLWPKAAVDNPSDKAGPDFLPNYQKDREYEGREPEEVFYFYTLDKDKMKEAFAQLKKDVKGWCLFGGVAENYESCASLAWKVLEAGQINKLIPLLKKGAGVSAQANYATMFASNGAIRSQKENSNDGSIYSTEQFVSPLVKSPDALITQMHIAKNTELKKYPLTKELDHAQSHEKIKKSECRIM